MLTPLTAEQANRVTRTLNESKTKLVKELSFSVDLQRSDRIAEIRAHIAKLEGMIVNGWNAPKF